MGYGSRIPANQVGGSKILWSMGEYGLSVVWVRRELTVLPNICIGGCPEGETRESR
jgi:hypothetical protein